MREQKDSACSIVFGGIDASDFKLVLGLWWCVLAVHLLPRFCRMVLCYVQAEGVRTEDSWVVRVCVKAKCTIKK